jgi:hypothetical protein
VNESAPATFEDAPAPWRTAQTTARRRPGSLRPAGLPQHQTREIAQAAGVTEHLLFRNFGSKAALFREALVLPFTSFVDEFGRTW